MPERESYAFAGMSEEDFNSDWLARHKEAREQEAECTCDPHFPAVQCELHKHSEERRDALREQVAEYAANEAIKQMLRDR